MSKKIQSLITTNKNWRGGISARKMLDESFVTTEQIDRAISTIERYFVPENSSAETRCIDGRCNSTLTEDQLGAQVPGGTPGAALAYRLGVIIDGFEMGTFNDDAHYMLENTLELGFVPGDHRDTHGHGTGCGAIDKMDQALAAMVSPELIKDNERLVRKVLGDAFDENVYMHIMGAALLLSGRSDEYLANREKSIEEVESVLHHSVSVLEGDHRECLLIINTVPKTTFATKRFCDDFDGMQAFNYDFWQTHNLAKALFPDDNLKKLQFITARVATSIATLMVLTDGSQRLIVRS